MLHMKLTRIIARAIETLLFTSKCYDLNIRPEGDAKLANRPCNIEHASGARAVVICARGTWASECATTVVVTTNEHGARRVDGRRVAADLA